MKNKQGYISYPPRICPSCKGDQFIEGPRGGLSVNMLCLKCLKEWNYTPIGLEPIDPARLYIYYEELIKHGYKKS